MFFLRIVGCVSWLLLFGMVHATRDSGQSFRDANTQTDTGPVTWSFRALGEDEVKAVTEAPDESFLTFTPLIAEKAYIDRAKALSTSNIEVFNTLLWALKGPRAMGRREFHDLRVLIEENDA
jgi:hypothetical protein